MLGARRYVDSVAGSQSPLRGGSTERDRGRDPRGTTPDSPASARDRLAPGFGASSLAGAAAAPAPATTSTSSSSSSSPARQSITPRRRGSAENVIRRRQQAIAEEERSGAASPDATDEGATSSVATVEARSSPPLRRSASEIPAAGAKGETGGDDDAEEGDEDNAAAAAAADNNDNDDEGDADPSFSAEGPAAVRAAASMAEYAAEVATEACAHQEDKVELPDGSVYAGQTRRNGRGDVEFHGLGRKAASRSLPQPLAPANAAIFSCTLQMLLPQWQRLY